MATKKVKGPNWANIKKLRNHLAKLRQTKYRKFSMAGYIRILHSKKTGDVVSVGELRKNGPECGSAACLAGEAVILLAPRKTVFPVICYSHRECEDWVHIPTADVELHAKMLLGLDYASAVHVFVGLWSQADLLHLITKKDAIRYLDKAIKEKDIFVCLDS